MPNIIEFGTVQESLPELTNPAVASDIMEGKEVIGGNKEIIVGTYAPPTPPSAYMIGLGYTVQGVDGIYNQFNISPIQGTVVSFKNNTSTNVTLSVPGLGYNPTSYAYTNTNISGLDVTDLTSLFQSFSFITNGVVINQIGFVYYNSQQIIQLTIDNQ